MLGKTIQGILAHDDIGDRAAVTAVLEKAREARNFIAHEGMAVGLMAGLRAIHLSEHVARLRSAISDLAVGDNLVSTWCFEISEKEPAPSIKDYYPLGELDYLLDSFDQDRDPTLLELLQRRKVAGGGS